MRRLTDSGVAVVVVSSEIPEVLGLADQVLVLAGGTVLHRGPARDLDEHTVLDIILKGDAAMSADVTKLGPDAAASPVPPATAGAPAGSPAGSGRSPSSTLRAVLGSPAGRNLGLVLALALLVLVGVLTGGDRFASANNALTILRLGSVIGVVSIGMTFVICGGGIDLSVGAIVALASVWATTLATQTMAADTHWASWSSSPSPSAPAAGWSRAARRLRERSRRSSRPRHAGRRPRPRRDHRPSAAPRSSGTVASSTSSAGASSASPSSS